MTIVRLTLAALALIATISPPLAARGNAVTVRLDITGGRLTQPLTVKEQAILDLSGVYQGTFLGPLTDAITPAWSRYLVTFVMEPQIPTATLPAGTQRTYVAFYARNPETDEGFVYLPGRGEDGYRTNIGVMIRDGHDGRWHQALPAWSELLGSYLPKD
ncbi:MAG: hypothetical protein ABI665_09210 [Vicinamibacterales bacterium]